MNNLVFEKKQKSKETFQLKENSKLIANIDEFQNSKHCPKSQKKNSDNTSHSPFSKKNFKPIEELSATISPNHMPSQSFSPLQVS